MTIIFSLINKTTLIKKKFIMDIDLENYFLIYRSISTFNIEILVEYRCRYPLFRALMLMYL